MSSSLPEQVYQPGDQPQSEGRGNGIFGRLQDYTIRSTNDWYAIQFLRVELMNAPESNPKRDVQSSRWRSCQVLNNAL